MTLWARFERGGQKIFGVVEGERLRVHSGDLFVDPVATGEELSIAELEWSTPCTPSKYIGLWNNYRAAALKQGNAIPEQPLYFIKSAGATSRMGASCVRRGNTPAESSTRASSAS
jgi:2-keto-4-pentenoate hydratase/2-oxohepta-3-ene-1,7-dioic acid hydratase in catechol pathway